MNHGRSPGFTGGEFENKNPFVICYALVTSQLQMKKSSISSTDLRAATLTGRMTQTVTHRRSAITPNKCWKLFYIHNIDFFWAPFHKFVRLGSLITFSSDNDVAETPVASLINGPVGLCWCVSVIKPTFAEQWFNFPIKHCYTSHSELLPKIILIVNLI